MSNFSIDLNQIAQSSGELKGLLSDLDGILEALNGIRQEVPRSLSIPIAVLDLMPGAIGKHVNDMQDLGTALDEILTLYRQHETAITDHATGGRRGGSGSGSNGSSADASPIAEIIGGFTRFFGNSADSSSGSASGSSSDPTAGMSYEEVLEYRAEHAVDENTRRLYERYRRRVRIHDDDYDDTAHYNTILNHINYNAQDDAVNPRGPGCTYFHEVGHLIDDQSDWNGHTSTDWSYDFSVLLQADVDIWLQNCMRRNGYSNINDAYNDLTNWLWTDPDMKNGISDLVCGITEGNSVGGWGHDVGYYTSSKICNEAFAHFFEAGMSADTTKLDYIKQIFPSAYAEFQRMIQDELD